ncbi:MAG: Arc family DNA-binding protein [Elusimicrobia bacterium]|nr:Arc family DNA-binding protein [Elusimicrobiota bacterium]
MKQGQFSEAIVRIDLRLPKSIHKDLKHKASEEGRSINSEILQALKRHLSASSR